LKRLLLNLALACVPLHRLGVPTFEGYRAGMRCREKGRRNGVSLSCRCAAPTNHENGAACRYVDARRTPGQGRNVLGAMSPGVSLAGTAPRTPNCRLPPWESTQSRLLDPSLSSRGRPGRSLMDLLYASCAGLDVHKETVVACVQRVAEASHNWSPDGSVQHRS